MNDAVKSKPIMRINSISIQHNNYREESPFECSISLKGGRTYPADINLKLDEEKTLAIINHVSDMILEATGIMIGDLRQEAQQLVEERRLKELPAPIEAVVGNEEQGIGDEEDPI